MQNKVLSKTVQQSMSYFKVVKVFNSRLNKKTFSYIYLQVQCLILFLGNRILTQYFNKTKPVKGYTWKREKVIDTSNFVLAYQYLLFHSFQESIWCLTGIVIYSVLEWLLLSQLYNLEIHSNAVLILWSLFSFSSHAKHSTRFLKHVILGSSC